MSEEVTTGKKPSGKTPVRNRPSGEKTNRGKIGGEKTGGEKTGHRNFSLEGHHNQETKGSNLLYCNLHIAAY